MELQFLDDNVRTLPPSEAGAGRSATLLRGLGAAPALPVTGIQPRPVCCLTSFCLMIVCASVSISLKKKKIIDYKKKRKKILCLRAQIETLLLQIDSLARPGIHGGAAAGRSAGGGDLRKRKRNTHMWLLKRRPLESIDVKLSITPLWGGIWS